MRVYPESSYIGICAYPGGRFAMVRTSADYQQLTCAVIDGPALWTVSLPPDANGFGIDVKCASDPDGNVTAICKAWSGSVDFACFVTARGASGRTATAGNNAVAIEYRNGRFVTYIMRSNGRGYVTKDRVVDLDPGQFPDGTSQGIRDVVDGEVRFGDEWYTRVVQGVTLAQPVQRGTVIVGQIVDATGSDRIVGWNGQALFTAIDRRGSREPQVRQSGTLTAVCARTPEGAAVQVFPPWPVFIEGAPPVPNDPHGPNPPPPPPPPPSGNTPNRSDIVQAEFARNPPAPNSTESCGQFTRRMAWRLNPTGDPNGWGLLTKSAGEAQYDGYAVDALIYGATQQVVDIITGAEGPNPQPGWLEVPKRDGNNWAPPLPVGTLPPPPPPDPPPPPPPPIDPGEPPVTEYHAFVGSATARYCSECGQAKTAAIHRKPAEPPVTGSDARIVARLETLTEAVRTADRNNVEGLDALRAAVVAGIAEAAASLKGGLGGIFKRK